MKPFESQKIDIGHARAKINLTLHVGRTISDGKFAGYHPVDSLVVFADIGDRLSYDANIDTLSLDISGPFGAGLRAEDDNLVLRAAKAFFKSYDIPVKGRFHLEKNLPLASGIGGGSADAAAALRLLAMTYQLDDENMMSIAANIGADVPVCYGSRTAHMGGIGERVKLISNLGTIPALLVNPGVSVSTPAVFKAFDSQPRAEIPAAQAQARDLLSIAIQGTNDLQDAAMALQPEIKDVIEILSKFSGCQLARMSGSGATCFALFESLAQAKAAQEIIAKRYPNYWAVASLLGGEVKWGDA